MEYKIEKISNKIHNLSEDESSIIKRAIPFYENVLERFEKMIVSLKEENDKEQETPKTLDEINPFNVKSSKPKNDLPNLDEVKTFIYSAWAKTVADVQTPYACGGQKKKNIVKHTFKEVEKGKFINRKVKEIMNDYILRLTRMLDLEQDVK